MPGGSAVISKVEGVSIDMSGSAGAGTIDGAGITGVGRRVAVEHALTYSVANIKSQKE